MNVIERPHVAGSCPAGLAKFQPRLPTEPTFSRPTMISESSRSFITRPLIKGSNLARPSSKIMRLPDHAGGELAGLSSQHIVVPVPQPAFGLDHCERAHSQHFALRCQHLGKLT